MIIRNLNDLHVKAPITYLANDEAAGTTVLRAKNTTGFDDGWAYQVGKTGEERTEVVLGTSTNVGTLTVATTDFAHPANTPVYAIKYDKVVFQKSTTGTAGTATPITDGTIEYQADAYDQQIGQSFTIFDDTNANTGDAFKTYFRNSTLALNTTESDWQTETGFTFYALGKLRQRVREKLWDSKFATDAEIDNWINEWKDEMTNALISVNDDYAIGTVNVAFDTKGLGTVTTSDFKQAKRIEVTYNGSDFFLSTKRPLNEYLPAEVVNSAHPYHSWEGDTVIRVFPNDDAGTAKIWYYQTGTPLVADTDELDLPLRAYTNSFVQYGLAQAYQKDGKRTASETQIILANAAKEQFIVESTPRDKSSQTYVKIEEVTAGEDNLIF